jgi:anti-sigma factor ChrR (cupin superfamily)
MTTETAARTETPALHWDMNEVPEISVGDGTHYQLLRADLDLGEWVIRIRIDPNVTLPRHKHTGVAQVATLAGSWWYLEYGQLYEANSFIYEQASSTHTFQAGENGTDLLVMVVGANLNLDEDGNVYQTIDAEWIRDFYIRRCEKQHIELPAFLAS